PILSLYPILFCFTLATGGRRMGRADVIPIAIAGLVFAFVANTRSYAFWQAGPLIAMLVLVPLYRRLPAFKFPWRSVISNYAILPVAIFGIVASTWIGFHHLRKDRAAYASSIFSGHEYWVTYVAGTMRSFLWRIPE